MAAVFSAFSPAVSPDTSSRNSGFTMIELAISLMVIGLLLGVILKGQELLDNARVASFVRHINTYETAAMTFKTSYGSLPGDISDPGDRLPQCFATNLCARGGNNNGIIRQWDTNPVNIEVFNFFPHLSRAGLVTGFDGGMINTTLYFDSASDVNNLQRSQAKYYFPLLLDRDVVVLTYPEIDVTILTYEEMVAISESTASHFKVPGLRVDRNAPSSKALFAIDNKLDDGMPNTGRVFLQVTGISGAICPTKTVSGVVEYDQAKTGKACPLLIKADF